MTSAVGMMISPIYGKLKNVPNHQPADVSVKQKCCKIRETR
jgi:hypothetical protein